MSLCSCLLRFSHQTTHTRELLNLVLRTTSSRIKHHVDSVKTLVVFGHLFHEDITQLIIHMSPSINHLIVTLGVGNESHFIVSFDLVDFILSLLHYSHFTFRNDNIIKVERQTCNIRHAIT